MYDVSIPAAEKSGTVSGLRMSSQVNGEGP